MRVRFMAGQRLAHALGALLLVIGSVAVHADQAVRVVTWNVETVGAPGSAQYEATARVLRRIDADLVAITEVSTSADVEHLADLAFDLGYLHSAVAPAGPFGGLRAAVISDFPVILSNAWSSAELSGDVAANDLTRYILEATVAISDDDDPLRVIVAHLKSGGSNTDAFRRAIEAYRIGQLAGDPGIGDDPVLIMGDLNADIGDEPMTPVHFDVAPGGLPTGFMIGLDVQAIMSGGGLINDPFFYLNPHAAILDARQIDGLDATRPTSGRRLDYVLAGPTIVDLGAAAQVYDCADEGLAGSLPLIGTPVDAVVCPNAADHLPVFADLVVPMASTAKDTRMNAAVLPYARAVAHGETATAFASVINSGNVTATGCSIGLPDRIPADFNYQTTNVSNALIGSPNTPVDIPPGATQNFVFGITPTGDLRATEIALVIDCNNTPWAASRAGLNTFILSAAASRPPDLLAIGVTPSGDGAVRLPSHDATGVFVAAAVNIGSAGTVTVSADDGGRGLPVNLVVCETNAGGTWLACDNSLTRAVDAGQTVYYTVVVTGTGSPIAFDPATNRLFLRFVANGATVGATNVAVATL